MSDKPIRPEYVSTPESDNGDTSERASDPSIATEKATAINQLRRIGLFAGFALVGFLGFASTQQWFGLFESNDVGGNSAIADAFSSQVSKASIQSMVEIDRSYRSLPPLTPFLPETSKELLQEFLAIAAHLENSYPNTPDSREMRARAEYEFGDIEIAKSIWTKLAKEIPDYAYAYRGLGDIATVQGDLASAVTYFRKAYLSQPNDPTRKLTLATALTTEGSFTEARDLLEEIVVEQPANALAQTKLGMTLKQLGQWDASKAALERAIEVDPDQDEAYLGLAQVNAKLGNRDAAKQYQDEFRSRSQESENATQERYDDFEALKTDVSSFYADMAKVCLGAADADSGKLLLLRARRLRPTATEPKQALAFLARQAGRRLEAIRWLRELHQSQPDQLSYLSEIASLYVEEGRIEDGLELVERFVDDYPEQTAAKMLLSRMHLTVLGNSELALQLANEAADEGKDLASYVWLASVAETTGNIEEAINALQRAISLAPEQTELKQRLQLLKAQSNDDEIKPSASNSASGESAQNN